MSHFSSQSQGSVSLKLISAMCSGILGKFLSLAVPPCPYLLNVDH